MVHGNVHEEQQLQQFLWGASTSSYQVEGGITNNDWNYFTTSEDIKQRLYALTKPNIFYKGTPQVILKPAGDALRTWHPEYYSHDFDLARQIGMNCFRLSLEWARIEPERGQWNQDAVDHYKVMIKYMQEEKELKPIITLNHLTLPLWVLTPPSIFAKKLGQGLLPSPLRDVPLADPISTDPYWKSLRGWENYETVKEFICFVDNIVQELKNQVDFWVTIGEPVASIIGLGYIAGLWPPGFLLDGNRAKKALHNLIEAHILAYNKIKELDDVDADGDGITNLTGFSHAMMEVTSANPRRILKTTITDNTQAAKNFAYFINDYFINAVVNGEEDLNYLKTLERHNKESSSFVIHENWKNKTDFIGINYYRRVYVYYSNIVALSSARFIGGALVNDLRIKGNNSNHHPKGILNDLGWEIYPQGLYNLIIHIMNQWGKDIPIFITENGIADKSDKYRAPFIVSHLHQIRQAIDNGANIIGYLHWSLMDNYEWFDHYRPEAKFGLFQVDRDDDDNFNLRRKITKGAEAYKLIIKESVNQSRYGAVTDSAISKAEYRFGSFSPDGFHISRPK
jgi:beta-glucosidase/6-phospho-beta-glucosidase/beta-galactosidase